MQPEPFPEPATVSVIALINTAAAEVQNSDPMAAGSVGSILEHLIPGITTAAGTVIVDADIATINGRNITTTITGLYVVSVATPDGRLEAANVTELRDALAIPAGKWATQTARLRRCRRVNTGLMVAVFVAAVAAYFVADSIVQNGSRFGRWWIGLIAGAHLILLVLWLRRDRINDDIDYCVEYGTAEGAL